MKTSILTVLFAFSISIIFAQETIIKGQVTANINEALGFTAVSCYNSETNEIISYDYADIDGNYTMTIKEVNVSFIIKAELLGYKNYTSKTLTTTKNIINHDIVLEEDAAELEEVVLFQKKRMMRMTGDKMIIDVAQSGIGVGNDGLQTLSKLPGMRLDKDENVVFRGNANLQIMIDGKPSQISGDDLIQFLKTLDGENIKSVEIIANPSAKYSASGTAGIVNIRLKKSLNSGLTGNLRTSVGYAEFIKNRNGINLYNNTQKWNLNFGLNYGYNESVNHRRIIQTIQEPEQTTVLEQFNDWLPVTNSYSGNFGISNKLNENSSIGSSLRYSIYKSDAETLGRTNEYYNNIYERYTILNTTDNVNNKTLTSNAFYTFASDSLDTKIDAQINYANYKNNSDRLTSNAYFDADTNSMYQEEEVVKNENPTMYNILSAKFDLEQNISDKINIETGMRYSYVNNDYDIVLKNKNTTGDFELDTDSSNRLIYKESILAGYGIANFIIEKWNFQTGLRAEYIDYNATSKTTNTTNKDNYLSLFPSFSINGNFNDNQFKFSYSRRIQRPRYLYLNPFFEYIDTYNVEVGNPDLTPEFTNAFELTWIRKYKTSLSLYANFSKDEMYQIVDYDEATQITTLFYDNIGKSRSIGLSFNTTLDVTKWWEMQLNTEVSYGQAESNIEDYKFNDSGINYYGNLNQSFSFENDLSLTWSTFYSKNGSYGNTTYKPSYDMSFGMRKELFNKKLRVNLSAQNVLKKSQWRQITTQDNVTTNWRNRWETRRFNLSLTYNFGSGKKKEVKSTDLSKEQRRL
ncbi:TonB-dependent receptor domain-containing protein [Lacinutrix chionoecetis]